MSQRNMTETDRQLTQLSTALQNGHRRTNDRIVALYRALKASTLTPAQSARLSDLARVLAQV